MYLLGKLTPLYKVIKNKFLLYLRRKALAQCFSETTTHTSQPESVLKATDRWQGLCNYGYRVRRGTERSLVICVCGALRHQGVVK